MRRGRTRFAAVLALAAALTGPVPPAFAAGGGHQATAWSLDGLWTWLRSVFPPLDTVQSDCGIMIDPDGKCHDAGAARSPGTVAPPVSMAQADCDRGGYIDPNGQCRVAVASSPVDPDR